MSKNRLAILPDLTHYEVFMSPLLVPHRAAVPQRGDQRAILGRAGRNDQAVEGVQVIEVKSALDYLATLDDLDTLVVVDDHCDIP